MNSRINALLAQAKSNADISIASLDAGSHDSDPSRQRERIRAVSRISGL